MYYIKRLYIFFSTLALIIFFFSTEVVKAKSFEINDIEIAQPFEINFDKNKVIDLGFKKAFFELIYSLIKSPDFKKIDNIRLNEIKSMIETFSIKEEKFIDQKYLFNIDLINWLDQIEFDPYQIDYYHSNVIARASKTMTECKNLRSNFKKTGTEG